MSRRKKARRRKDYSINQLINYAVIIFVFSIVGFFLKYKEKIVAYQFVALAIVLAIAVFVLIISFILKKRRVNYETDYFNEDKYLWTLRGMPHEEFEKQIAAMFTRLGYKAEHTGHSHDGGIDVIAKKDGEKYLIQCKHYLTKDKVGVEAVRAFRGVVAENNAKKGFFITTNKFTLEARKEFEDNPRVELVDDLDLVKHYYMPSLEKKG